MASALAGEPTPPTRARRQGYAVQRGETTPELGTISVPLFGARQVIVGTLGIAFPAHMVGEDQEAALVEALHQHARILSQRVGGTVYPFGGTGVPPSRPGAHRRTARTAESPLV